LNIEDTLLKRDFILIYINKSYSMKFKLFNIKVLQDNSNLSGKSSKVKQSIDNLIYKIKALILIINIMFEKLARVE
jgi:hypothetical protein